MTRMPDLGRCVIQEPTRIPGHSRRVFRPNPDGRWLARLLLYVLSTERGEPAVGHLASTFLSWLN